MLDPGKTWTEFLASPDNHDGVVERALSLLHELLGPAPQDERAALRLRAAVEEVEPLTAHLARQRNKMNHGSGISCNMVAG